ncbi:MAG: helix-turn-helix transcriptional regulator [Planctomycetes bacterium]|nr:helix-turn-helix transcriptional regulator [Planctomycetota bacterium]
MRNQETDDGGIRERLHRLINERSQSEIARKTGAQVAAVNRYVHGARIPAAFCASVVRGLGVNPSWLLMGEGSPYLADVPEQTAALGENMLELVEAMSAVSRMLLGSLAGKHHMKVLRELNDALLAHEKLREQINTQTRPVFRRILDDLEKALHKLDLERAIDLRKAADQLSRLCDDETLTRDYLRVCAFHEFQLKHSEDFLRAQRKVFLRSLPDGDLFDERACDEARRIVVALIQMNRIPEAMRIIRAVRSLAGRKGREWQAWARLENTYAVLLAETGQLYRGIELIQQSMPRLAGMYRAVSEAALVKMLLWSNVLSIDDAIAMGTPNDARARHILQFACWQLDRAAVGRAMDYAQAPGVEVVWGRSYHHAFALHLKEQMDKPAPGKARAMARDYESGWGKPEDVTDRFNLAAYSCELERVGGYRKPALEQLWKAEEARRKHYPEFVPGPLELATHYRAALKLLDKPKTNRERALVKRAGRHFQRRIAKGYLCFKDAI